MKENREGKCRECTEKQACSQERTVFQKMVDESVKKD